MELRGLGFSVLCNGFLSCVVWSFLSNLGFKAKFKVHGLGLEFRVVFFQLSFVFGLFKGCEFRI